MDVINLTTSLSEVGEVVNLTTSPVAGPSEDGPAQDAAGQEDSSRRMSRPLLPVVGLKGCGIDDDEMDPLSEGEDDGI